MRVRGRALGFIGVMGVMALAAPSAAIAAPAETSPQSITFTTAESAAASTTGWVVPDGVDSITLTVTGGNGGTNNAARPGGRGAVVTATIAVEPGQALAITLGADGGTDGVGGAGYGAGGNGVISGGGGASTAVTLDGTMLVIAGGGGGSSASSSAGGGGAGGTPDGQPGTRRGGSGGAAGIGGIGVAPWGGPGGTGNFGSGGQVNGTEAGAGGGGGFGGGGASGAYGDGGGGGSFVATEATATFSTRLDDLADGWVQIDYQQLVVEPAPEPTVGATEPIDRTTIAGIPMAIIGAVAGGIVVLGAVLLIVGRRTRRA